MANVGGTYQQVNTISVRRDAILDIATSTNLNKADLRVLLLLLTHLDGYNNPKSNGTDKDPLNFKNIDIESMAETLEITKKKVRNSVDKLTNLYLLERGSNDTIKNGYRFTF